MGKQDGKPEKFFHPIIYVRGYAMTRAEIDDTTADPFCGFNLGSTVFRATADRAKPPRKYIFESPVLRLASDYGYADVFADGYDIMDEDWEAAATLPRRSIVIFRYYDPASTLLGSGKTPPIDTFGAQLGKLIGRVRDLVVKRPENGVTDETFGCYLIAHSMGGLVCRAFLQNPALDPDNMRRYVDKFFTYATPHNGIEMVGANVPSWLALHDVNTFSREQMAKYLDLDAQFQQTKSVNWIPESRLSSERVFCLIGTNRNDYEAAQGLSRTFVGHGSDGLVRIENAWACGIQNDGTPSSPVAKAFVYRSHSGFFGIVNSEEAYQNLTRFLFGDLRIDIWIDVGDIRLPADVQREEAAGKKVDALYQFEVLAAPRGKLWYLTRRVAEEDSVACLRYADLKASATPTTLHVSTVFLDRAARIDPKRESLAYSMTLGVRVPDYEVERKLWLDQHFEGGYLFHDSVKVEIFPPGTEGREWVVKYDWQSENSAAPSKVLPWSTTPDGKLQLLLPFDGQRTPGIRGNVRFIASVWNAWNR
jgi:hypothetical protein